ncbi:hypothetical protein GCM10029963_09190 [Micromonospora andamanensis]
MSGSLPPGMALLVVRRGPNAGARFLLDHDVTTSGRHPDSDIFLDDVTVSRRHAEFHRDGGTFTVRDVGSLNGTYVNRERVEAATLSNGDEVQIGKFRVVFIAGPRPEGEAGRGERACGLQAVRGGWRPAADEYRRGAGPVAGGFSGRDDFEVAVS